MDFHKKRVRQF